MDMNLFFNALTGFVTTSLGVVGYAYKRTVKRVDSLENCNVKNKIAIEKRPTEDRIKEIFTDKIAPIHVMLENIQEDIKEIKEKK